MDNQYLPLMHEDILSRNHVHVSGKGERNIVLAHGFGCDQNMWRFLVPDLEKRFRVVVFDYVGSGNSSVLAYDKNRYQDLEGYAQDVIEICDTLDLKEVIFVGHSVSSIIGTIASVQRPDLFSKLVMVCPSPCFLNLGEDYSGGFNKEDLEELINLMDKNFIGWANYLAPLVMGQSHSEELINELSGSFCSTDPQYAKPFAKATFFSDHRSILSDAPHPCLIIQSTHDSLAAVEIGEYMAEEIPNSKFDLIEGIGHCLHMTEPKKVLDSIHTFLKISL